jgi:hypothetical protein
MLFSKPVPPQPLERWFKDPISVTRLRELLDDPVMQQAAAMLLQAAMPTHQHVLTGDSNNERLCWLGGYSDFLRDLNRLTKVPAAQNDPHEWDHIFPDPNNA